ncbi:MAG: HAMP domain-containing histidine kinase [Anaerolineae bacterium]|nr:HAMP domain-containing histidine kinase [Anaerolineae bacterium]
MKCDVAQLILKDQDIAYAIADRDLMIVETGGMTHIFDPTSVGRSLHSRVPELIGNEAVLYDILDRKLPCFQLERINRPVRDGTSYMTLTVRPYQGDNGQTMLLVVIWDTSEQGQFAQMLAHQRNELRLLRQALTEANEQLATRIEELHVEIAERVRVENALRESEQALRQYATELAAHNDELNAFAHTVAHDLKSPLTVLIGYSNLLEAECGAMSEDELRHDLQLIGQNGHRISNIVNELLLLASVREVNNIRMHPLNTAQIIAEIRGRLALMIAEYKAELVAPETWPVATSYGPWVEEIWVNYVSNAIKYGGHPPRIELGYDEGIPGPQHAEKNDDCPMVRFWVRDNGDGLSPEQQTHLFTPFERLQARAEGHGLGLSIVRRIVGKLGGEVGVESQVGQGSTFFFTLPRG